MPRLVPIMCCFLGVFFLMGQLAASADDAFHYPATERSDHVDHYHGQTVSDPYRWLEANAHESPQVTAWIESQNRVTNAFLDQLPWRAKLEARLTQLWDYEKYGVPFKEGGKYFYFKNNGLQNQSVLYTLPDLDADAEVLVDPNLWSDDGTVSWAGGEVSKDGKYLAYARSEGGSDWTTWHVMEVATKKLLADELKWVKFSGVAWGKDSQGFFYARYPAPEQGAEYLSSNLNQKVYYHRVGTPQSDDRLVYERPDHPEWGFGAEVTEDGAYLVLTTWKGTDDKYRIVVIDLRQAEFQPIELIDSFEAGYELVGNQGTQLFFKTNRQAPRGRVIAIDLQEPAEEHWVEIIPQSQETLESVHWVGGTLIAQYLKDAHSQVLCYGLDGRRIREIPLPGIGTASGFSGSGDDPETFYAFTSFATPPSIYRYDVQTGTSESIRTAQVDFRSEDYVVKQAFYESKDGTRVPIFVAHRRDLSMGWSATDTPLRLRWLQYLANTEFQCLAPGLDGDGRRICNAQSAWWRRVRRSLARSRKTTQKAECLRRFSCRGRVARGKRLHQSSSTGDSRSQQRWLARGRVPDATT